MIKISKVLYLNSSEGSKEDHEKLTGRDSNQIPSEYEGVMDNNCTSTLPHTLEGIGGITRKNKPAVTVKLWERS
jgi:hypothetical protein